MTDRAQIALDVQGMTCEGCASHVEKALRGVAGHDAKVPSWRAARATVLAAADVADDTLTRSVEEAGDHAEQRRLAAAARSDQEGEFPEARLEVHAAERVDPGLAFSVMLLDVATQDRVAIGFHGVHP